jgi:hypothetical protein
LNQLSHFGRLDTDWPLKVPFTDPDTHISRHLAVLADTAAGSFPMPGYSPDF